MLRFRPLLLCLLLVPAVAAAEEATPTERAAQAASAAIHAGDAKALAGVANADDPDPWQVALALLRAGEREDATRLAAAATTVAVRGLADAVAAWPAGSPALTKHLDDARAALAARDAPRAQACLDALLASKPRGMLAVEAHALRARVRDAVGALVPASTAYVAAATEAEAIGWLTRASDLWYRAGLMLFFLDAPEQRKPMLAHFRRQGAVEARLGSSAGRGRGHFRAAVALEAMGEAEQALQELAAAVPLLVADADHEYHGRALGLQATLVERRGDTAQALELSCQAATLLGKADGAGLARRFQPTASLFREAVRRNVTCASFATKLGAFDRAATYKEAARKKLERQPESRLATEIRGLLALIDSAQAYREGRLLDATGALETAEAAFRELQRASRMAGVMRRRSAILETLGDLPAAHAVAVEALAIAERADDKRGIASALVRMAAADVRLGRLPEAGRSLDRAFEMAAAIGEPELEIEARRVRARWHQARGELSKAVLNLRGARSVARTHQMAAPQAMASRDLAELIIPMGYLEEGRALLAEARATYEALHAALDLAALDALEGRLLLEEAARLDAVGSSKTKGELLRASRGRFETARGRFEERNSGFDLLFCLEMLTRIAFDLGEYPAALSAAQEAHERAVAMELPSRQILNQAVLARAQCYSAHERATCDKTMAEAVAAADASPDMEIRALVRYHAADLAFQRGRSKAALALAEQALSAAQDYGLGLSEGDDAALRGALLAETYGLGRQAALAAGDVTAFYRFVDKSRASTLVAALGGAEALRGIEVEPQLRAAEEAARAAVARARARYKRASRRRNAPQRNEASKALRRAQDELHQAIRLIRQTVRSQADLAYGEVTPLATFQGTLDAGDVALLYVREFTGSSKEPHFLVLRVDAGPKAKPRIIDLGPAGPIDKQLAALYADEDHRVDAAAVTALASLLFQGIDLTQAKRLLISPGDALAAAPFPAMQPQVDIALMPSVTAMGMLAERQGPGAAQAIALGRPIYARGDPRRLDDLPETESEAKAVVAALGGESLLRQHATETRFIETVATRARWRTIHFACHGIVDMVRATRSYLALSIDEANDGNLYAREVFNLAVPADLVVLSGCETGRGQVIRGDGLTGLMRAFMQAGAPRVICSLWKVDDEATAVLMKHFYAEWKTGRVSAATALRRAQAHVAKQPQWKHPEFWAAWVVWGLPD